MLTEKQARRLMRDYIRGCTKDDRQIVEKDEEYAKHQLLHKVYGRMAKRQGDFSLEFK